MDPEMFALYSPGSKIYKNLWEKVIDDAEEFNDPGRFTAFIGFEWTSLIKGNNMHRVVMMRDGPTRARQVVPFTMTAPQGSPDPRDLWKYMRNYEEVTRGEILAIAHNGNLSNGIMFPLEAQWNGTELDESYITERAKWEPVYEITQIKGDGEAHPFLSPDDEFANYETWDIGNLAVGQTVDEILQAYPTVTAEAVRATLAYAADTQQVLMFGGRHASTGTLGELWGWNGATWQHLGDAEVRRNHACAFDTGRNQLVLHGGDDTGSYSNDTSEWDGATWTHRTQVMHQVKRVFI